MRNTENVELTVLCLIEDCNRILLQNRTKKDWHGYTLPGGHVGQGELLKVMNTPELTEFQYIVEGDEWIVSIK